MLVLPVPMFAAIVLVYLLVRAVLRGEVHPLIRLVIALCALQAVFVSLRQYYGVPWVGLIQPITAATIGAAASRNSVVAADVRASARM